MGHDLKTNVQSREMLWKSTLSMTCTIAKTRGLSPLIIMCLSNARVRHWSCINGISAPEVPDTMVSVQQSGEIESRAYDF